MPERPPASRPAFALWLRLGRLLPNHVRGRVYEPLVADLYRDWVERPESRATPFAMRVLLAYAGCLRVALPGTVMQGGRLTRLGRWAVAVVAMTAVVVIFLAQVSDSYAN